MLVRLELVKCADTPIGNEVTRGVSGGERKRTSIGCELMVNPSVLLVDEPTSGLDSNMARSVCEHLATLAHNEGRTVITVIHQPSWSIFNLFDSLVLLKDGRVIFNGPVEHVEDFFTSMGFTAPPHENPMDYYFDILKESPATSSGLHKNIESGYFAEQWGRTPAAAALTKVVEGDARDVEAAALAATEAGNRTSLWSQFLTLTDRCAYDYVRDKKKLVGGIGMKFTIGMVFGIIWLNQVR